MAFSFSRNPWLTVCSAGALAVLLALGTWQVQRLFWKQELIATAEMRLKEEPTALPADTDGKGLEHRRVNITGTFAHDREIHYGVRYRKGVVGFAVLTPMKLADGRWLLVNRGWVPPEKREPETRKDMQLQGEVSLLAMVREPKKKGYFVPENNLAKNYWFYVDLNQAKEFTGLELLPFYAEAIDPTPKGVYPETSEPKVNFLNDHLQYAIIWYTLAGVLVIMYVVYQRRRDA